MLTIDRTTILKGPCLIINQGTTFYSAGDVTVAPKKTTWDVPTSINGRQTDQRLKDIFYTVSFKQDGQVTAAILALVFRYGTTQTGTSIFGSTDQPLRIVSLNDVANNYLTFNNTAISKMPGLALKTDATLFDTVEFTCLGSNNTAFNAANRFVSIATKTVSGTISGTSNANPDVMTTAAAHGLAVNDPISIVGVLGDTNVNGNFYVLTTPTATTLTISATQGGTAVVGAAAYTSGGTWALGWPFVPTNILSPAFAGTWATSIPTGNITGTSEASPDVITTSAAHGLNVNDKVTIAGDTGDTAVNGTWYVLTTPTATTFTISATQGGAAIAGAGTAGTGGTFTRANALDLFDTEDGMQITFDLSLTPKRSNSLGTYDMLFSSLTVKAKGKPIGPTVIDMINAIQSQGTNVQLGASMAAQGQNLKLVGTGIYFWLYQAFISTNPTMFSAEKLRVDDVEWVATRSYTGNTPNPLFKISTTAITS